MLKVVIRAGGIGTRLWPYSRKRRPKQFQALAGEGTMLQETYSRIAPMAGPGDVFVSTGPEMVGLVRAQLPVLPEGHLIVEPALRNTGPAVALECALLEARWPGCTVASLGSDHYIGRPGEFRRLLSAAVAPPRTTRSISTSSACGPRGRRPATATSARGVSCAGWARTRSGG